MAFPHRATSLGQTWFAKPWISLPTFAGFEFRKILRTLERARLRSGFDFSIFSPWSIWAENTLADCPKFRIHHITEWSANKGALHLKHLKQSQVMQEFVHRMHVYWHIGHYWGSHVQIKKFVHIHRIMANACHIMYSFYTIFTSGKMNAAWRFTKKGFQCFDSCFLFTSTWEMCV